MSKRWLLCTLRSRPALWWNLGSNIGVVASVKSITETNVTFRDTLKLLMLRPAHIFAFYASRNSKPDDHCRDTKLECTNNAVYIFSFRGAAQNWWICVLMMDPGGLKYWTCNKALNHKQHLMRHVESFHVETSPYTCNICLTNVELKKNMAFRDTHANHR
jgi:hypothetical protein